MIDAFMRRARQLRTDLPRIAVDRLGAPPAWLGYRHWLRETVPEYLARAGRLEALKVIHPERIHPAALPRNVAMADVLPDTRGWWGFSFRDVPARHNAATITAVLPDCLVAHYRTPPEHRSPGDYYVGILNADRRSVEMREIRFRESHAAALRAGRRVERIARATWVIERVFHNHSHWLGIHLPKLLLLRERRALDDVVLHPELPAAHRASLRLLGMPAEDFCTYDPDAVQRIEELTVVGTDRFRPELVRLVRDAVWSGHSPAPRRRVFVSRRNAARRRLLNEEQIWRLLKPQGFERVEMEGLPFEAQVQLMMETRVLVAPHGAGLTNMIFCAPGTQVVEIADFGFPNPNFYALASALGHDYWLIPGEGVGEGHPLVVDLRGDAEQLAVALPHVLERSGA